MTDEIDSPLPPISAWSFSALKQFEKCAYATYLQKVAKEPSLPRDDSHPLERGTRIHKDAELFVVGELVELPQSLRKFEHDFEALRTWYQEGKLEVEQDWAFDLNFKSVGWYDPDVWLRAKCDAVIHHDDACCTIIDYKTGKSWGNEVPHAQQGQLFAITAFERYPNLVAANTEFWYLDEGKTVTKSYTRSMVPLFEPRWIERALALTTTTQFPPKPSKYACKYCDYGNEKGTGACGFAVS